MADAPATDIFTAIHRAIWDALKAHAAFTDVVDLRNRVDMTADAFEDFPPNVQADATPEVAVVQAGYSQEAAASGSAGVRRTQAFALIVTVGELSPVQMNVIKEAWLDALLARGPTLGMSVAINGNKVTSWSVGGEDSLTTDGSTPGADRVDVRSQSVGRITVNFLKALPARQAM